MITESNTYTMESIRPKMERIQDGTLRLCLQDFRKQNKLYQAAIAEYLNVSIAFVSAIERGEARMPADKLIQILNHPSWNTSGLLVEAQSNKNDYKEDYRVYRDALIAEREENLRLRKTIISLEEKIDKLEKILLSEEYEK